MYKVMIVGHGFVGSAVASLFSEKEKFKKLDVELGWFSSNLICSPIYQF